MDEKYEKQKFDFFFQPEAHFNSIITECIGQSLFSLRELGLQLLNRSLQDIDVGDKLLVLILELQDVGLTSSQIALALSKLLLLLS